MIRTTIAPVRTATAWLLLSALAPLGAAESTPGQVVFATFCAACHGPEGAGLVGPNLTDTVFLHGGTKADIVKVITKGVGDKGMPTWEPILTPTQIDQVADHLVGMIGKNLKSPFAPGKSSVTPFPKGSTAFPLLMRSFMPTLGIDAEAFPHHSHGKVIAKYSPEKGGDVDGEQKPVDGVPSAIAVNFGDALSYCFDTTECRLLYTWSGPFMDMTNYWGPGSGGGRKSFNYVPVVAGPVWFRTKGKDPFAVAGAGTASFSGYRKVKNIPELLYRVGAVEIALRISPGAKAGVAVCHYATTGVPGTGAQFQFSPDDARQITCDKGQRKDDGTLVLSAADAADFTLTITPLDKPVLEAPKPSEKKDDKKNAKPAAEVKE
jgi:cytochrome c551/c552